MVCESKMGMAGELYSLINQHEEKINHGENARAFSPCPLVTIFG
jgi:hypothetical protein